MQVTHLMAMSQTTGLEASLGPCLRARHRVPGSSNVLPCRSSIEDGKHVSRVGLPVGGQPELTAGADAFGESGDEFALDQAPLLVTLLRPGVGKEDLHPIESPRREHPRQDLRDVGSEDADIAHPCRRHPGQKRTHSRFMNLDTDETAPRIRCRHGQQRLPHTETDFECQRALDIEAGIPETRRFRGGRVDTKVGPVFGHGPLLGIRQSPATNEAANTPRCTGFSRCFCGWMLGAGAHVLPPLRAAAAASQIQPAMNARPPKGVMGPSHRGPPSASR